MKTDQPFDLYKYYQLWFNGSVDDEIVRAFADNSRVTSYKKGDVIFQPEIEHSITTFLLDGVVKTYILSPDGTENTFAIYFMPGTGVAMTADMINIPGIHMKALTDCKTVEMPTTSPYDLAKEYPDLYRELLVRWQPFYYGMMDKLRAGYTMTAKERYLWFLNKYPQVVDRISLMEVANFLGIAPQSLSRIRAELAEEQGVTPPRKINN